MPKGPQVRANSRKDCSDALARRAKSKTNLPGRPCATRRGPLSLKRSLPPAIRTGGTRIAPKGNGCSKSSDAIIPTDSNSSFAKGQHLGGSCKTRDAGIRKGEKNMTATTSIDPRGVGDKTQAATNRNIEIRDRIRELRRMRAKDLVPNPKNWRRHPKAQADALRGLLAEVGYADALLVRELSDGRLMLIDASSRRDDSRFRGTGPRVGRHGRRSRQDPSDAGSSGRNGGGRQRKDQQTSRNSPDQRQSCRRAAAKQRQASRSGRVFTPKVLLNRRRKST